jgi:hypothetical protein
MFIGEVTIHVGENLIALSKGDEHFLMRVANTEVDMESYDFLFDKEAAGYIITSLPILKDKVGTLRLTKSTQVAKMTIEPDDRQLILSAHEFARGRIKLPLGIDDLQGQTPDVLVDSSCLEKATQAVSSNTCMVQYLMHEGDGCDIVVLKLFDEEHPLAVQAIVLPIQE